MTGIDEEIDEKELRLLELAETKELAESVLFKCHFWIINEEVASGLARYELYAYKSFLLSCRESVMFLFVYASQKWNSLDNIS